MLRVSDSLTLLLFHIIIIPSFLRNILKEQFACLVCRFFIVGFCLSLPLSSPHPHSSYSYSYIPSYSFYPFLISLYAFLIELIKERDGPEAGG